MASMERARRGFTRKVVAGEKMVPKSTAPVPPGARGACRNGAGATMAPLPGGWRGEGKVGATGAGCPGTVGVAPRVKTLGLKGVKNVPFPFHDFGALSPVHQLAQESQHHLRHVHPGEPTPGHFLTEVITYVNHHVFYLFFGHYVFLPYAGDVGKFRV